MISLSTDAHVNFLARLHLYASSASSCTITYRPFFRSCKASWACSSFPLFSIKDTEKIQRDLGVSGASASPFEHALKPGPRS